MSVNQSLVLCVAVSVIAALVYREGERVTHKAKDYRELTGWIQVRFPSQPRKKYLSLDHFLICNFSSPSCIIHTNQARVVVLTEGLCRCHTKKSPTHAFTP